MLETILNHRTIRNFKNTAISDQILNQILMAASRAATTGNMQVYSIIVSKEAEKKKQLWEAHFKQGLVLQAPLILTFCADYNRFNIWCENRKAEAGYDNFLSFFTGSIDAILACQNASLAAESLGLGTCYLGTTTYMASKISKILSLPAHVVPVVAIAIGYAQEIPELTDRLPLEAIVHFEEYSNYTSESITQFYEAKENSEIYQNFIKEHNKETLAQVFTDIRYKKSDNVYFSGEFLKEIENKGFMNNSMPLE